ncbi:MAG: CRISPR-associated protein [Candidatus Scalindua rubra]|uniref:CRISPR system Cms protein Csm2 n=1 Tax=Candidatus Scalindua rubra TaxID=1872076 RepID=A0A1E3X5U7_9BACT|nr:MAG: CRISPR-associated protein [Candidatus Scalindua rubra]
MEFWKNKEEKQLNPDLFSSNAEILAKKIYDEGSNKINKPSQIRKFYNEVLRFDNMLKENPNPDEFYNILPYLKMLNAKVAYALGRNLVSNGFKDFISDSLKQIKDKEDFDAFAGLFEAFMGYYKYFRPSEGGGR